MCLFIGHNDISLISKNNKSFFLRLTVKQNLDFFYYTCLNKNRISIFELNRLIREFNVEELLEKEFNELSSGQSQKISIIRALIKNPKLLLFDECFSSLDKTSKISFKNFYEKYLDSAKNKTTIWVTHDPKEISFRKELEINFKK